MREFRGYEYVDGDITVYTREEGQGDDAWRKQTTLRFDQRQRPIPAQVVTVEQTMGVILNETETKRLLQELAWPRRW